MSGGFIVVLAILAFAAVTRTTSPTTGYRNIFLPSGNFLSANNLDFL